MTLSTVAPGRETACIRISEIAPELVRTREGHGTRDTLGRDRDGGGRPARRVEGLVKTFGTTQALRGVTLEVLAGESVGLVGESGSGKSTLARCLLGLEQPDGGTIEIDGIDATQLRTAARRGPAPRARRDPDRLPGPVLLAQPGAERRRDPARGAGVWPARATPSSELLGARSSAASYARRKPAALSGGERQRVAIARALAVQTEAHRL